MTDLIAFGAELASSEKTQTLIQLALTEDLGNAGDVTCRAAVEPNVQGTAIIEARNPLVVSGNAIAQAVFTSLDASIEVDVLVEDGETVASDAVVQRITGPLGALFTAERTALNFMQRMTGIATLTAQFKQALHGLDCAVLDTRKTLPGYRALDKYAVLCGGGKNHRMGLYDRVMLKDNHIAHWTRGGSLADAVQQARQRFPDLVIQAEADRLDQVSELLEARPDWILLDNMTQDQLRGAVEMCRGKCKTEASGGITLETVRAIAETGVDAVSVGALTHSVVAADLGMELE